MEKLKWLCMILLLTGGCTPLKITNSWKARNAAPQKYNNILVVEVGRDTSGIIRKNMKDQMVAGLKKLGYNAVSSLKVYGSNAFDKIDEVTALNELRDDGIDAVITITLLHVEKERAYIPEAVYYPPNGDSGSFRAYKTAQYSRMYGPQYYIIDIKYYWESNLYDMSIPRLVYSVQTQSFPPESSGNLAHKYRQIVVKNMIEQRLLEKIN